MRASLEINEAKKMKINGLSIHWSLPPVYDHYPKAKVQTGTYTLKQDKQPLHQQFEEVLL